ncbi:MAG TPA: MASE1 domain-containing protein [Candidatus Baltobacteraceae bacterium]|nr:MASE1 domain-containing protein [Candidatus Baltobacteraceae bacterium]
MKVASKLLTFVLVAVAYVGFAHVGQSLASATQHVAAVWPPTGIAMAALLLLGYRVWPGILAGAFFANAFSVEPLWAVGAIAIGNTIGPMAGVAALHRFGFDYAMERVRDIALLVLLASATTAFTATSIVAALAVSGSLPWPAFASTWWVSWGGNMMSVLLVAPLVLTWNRGHSKADGGPVELGVLLLALLVVTALSFESNLPLAYPVYPFVMWAAVRFRQRETALVVTIVAAIAIAGTTHHLGPFVGGTFERRLAMLLSFALILAVTGYLLGAVTAQRRSATARLRDVADTLKTAFLPDRLPQTADLRCDAVYVTARRDALIGGDWFDAFELPGGAVVISIGDVIGHGLEAAVSAARIRQSIFATAFETADPASILLQVDRMMRIQGERSIATALIAVIEPARSWMTHACAGHLPPVLVESECAARYLAYGGIPLGVGAAIGVPFETQAFRTELRGDCVIAFHTDGLTEFGRDSERGESALLDALSRVAADADLVRPADFVLQAVMRDNRPVDDTVLLVVRTKPRRQWHVPVADAATVSQV